MCCQRTGNNIKLQQKIEWQETIDELWEFMQIPKKSQRKMKKAFHYGIVWKVKNCEGRSSKALQYKVWKPGRLQLKNDEDNAAYGQQQHKVWDPGEIRTEGT